MHLIGQGGNMLTRKNESLYRRTIMKFGEQHQILKAIEELLELAIELVKYLVGKGDREHIIEEINDVMITNEQVLLIFKVKKEELAEERKYKLNRLEETIK